MLPCSTGHSLTQRNLFVPPSCPLRPLRADDDDFRFKIVAPENGQAGAISIQSLNFPDHFLGPVAGGPVGRVGIQTAPFDKDAFTFVLAPGESDATNFTIVSQTTNATMAGYVLTVVNTRTNPCGDGVDVVLAAPVAGSSAQTFIVGNPPPPPPPPPTALTVDATVVDHAIKDEHQSSAPS